jgi:transglutaminase-like putative cysteine protease
MKPLRPVLLLGVLACITRAAEPASEPVTKAPPPAWVEVLPWSLPAGAPPARTPAEALLIDGQDRLTPQGCDYYFRTVIRLLNAEGVRQNAERAVEFSPDHQTITWHTLALTRDGAVLDRLPAAQFRRLQRERDLEAQMLNGRHTLATVLEDVRAGDVLDVAYTIRDTNPLMRGAMSARHQLGAGYPVRRERVIVRTPARANLAASIVVPPGTRDLADALFRPSALRAALETETIGDEKIFRWEGADLAAVRFDEAMPAVAYPFYPMVQVSSFRTWADVAEWAEPLFAQEPALPEPALALVREWEKLPSPAARLAAAVAWVQNDLRYFALAIGPHNLQPRPLAEVCATRFGDCKDKSLLLARLLRALGFEAWPALVHSAWRGRLHELAPSPFAFNHAIVAYRFEGALRWLDPTLKGQRGAPGAWAVPPYGAALILRPDEAALTALPADPLTAPDTRTREIFQIEEKTGDAIVSLDVQLRGLQADFYRNTLDTLAADQLGRNWLNFIGRFHKQIEEIEPVAVQDDAALNLITLRARYRLPGFVRTEGGKTSVATYAWALRALIDPPATRRRHWPHALPHDRFVRHRLEIALPFDTALEQQPQIIAGDGVEYRVEKGVAGRRFVAEHDLRVTAEFVPAEHMGRYADAVDEMIAAMGTTLTAPAPAPAR